MLLITIAVELLEFIQPAIPQVVSLLGDRETQVRETSLDTLVKLSEQGKISDFVV